MKLISPMGVNVNPINTAFNWSKCSPSDTVTFYLWKYTSSGYQIQSQIGTTLSQYIALIPLSFGTKYKWTVNQNNKPGDTATFIAGYNDSLAIGTYLVSISFTYSCEGPPDEGPFECDSFVGTTKVSVTELTPGTLLFRDTSIVHTQFTVNYSSVTANNPQVYPYNGGYNVVYENLSQSSVQVSTPNQLYASKDSTINNFNSKFQWSGIKIQ